MANIKKKLGKEKSLFFLLAVFTLILPLFSSVVSAASWDVSNQTDWSGGSFSAAFANDGVLKTGYFHDFEDVPVGNGNLPSGWTVQATESYEGVDDDDYYSGSKSLHLRDAAGSAVSRVSDDYISSKDRYISLYAERSSARNNYEAKFIIKEKSSNNVITQVDFADTQINGNGYSWDNSDGRWQHIEVYHDRNNSEDTVWIDGSKIDTASFMNPISGDEYNWYTASDQDVHFDDILIRYNTSSTWTSHIWDAGTSKAQKIDSLELNSSIGTNESVKARVTAYDDSGTQVDQSAWISLEDGLKDYRNEINLDPAYQYQIKYNLSVTDNDTSHSPSVHDYNIETVDEADYVDYKVSSQTDWLGWELGREVRTVVNNSQVSLSGKDAVGWWSMDEGTGTTAYDQTSKNNHGTINGATWTTGKFGQALNFDGTDDYVQTGTDFGNEVIGSGFTMSAWINVASFSTENSILYEDQTDGARSYAFYTGTDGSLVGRIFDSSGNNIGIGSSTTISAGEWYFVTFTWDGNTMKVGINGQTEASTSVSSMADSGETTRIGLKQSNERAFDGKIDEVRIFDQALSEDKIEQFYKRTKPDSFENNSIKSGPWTSKIWDARTSLKQKLDLLHINTTIGTNETVEVRLSVDSDDDGSIEETSSWVSLSDGTNSLTASDFDIDTSGYRYQVGFNLSVTDGDTSHSPSVSDFDLSTRQATNMTVTGRSPEDGAIVETTDVDLSVTVDHDTGDSMDVMFYNASDDSQIGSTQTISNSGTATVTWSGLSDFTTHNWYAEIDDGTDVLTLSDYSFTVETGKKWNVSNQTDWYNNASSSEVDVRTTITSGQLELLGKNAVGWWSMDDDSDTTVYDLTSLNNDGSMYGGMDTSNYVSGQHDTALDFAGGDDYVETNDISGMSTITYGMWVKPDTANQAKYATLLSNGFEIHQQFGYDQTFRAALPIEGSGYGVFDSSSWSDDTWYFVVVTYDGETIRMYRAKKGNELSEVDTNSEPSGSLDTDNNNFRLGTDDKYDEYSDATMDEVFVFNRALSSTAIEKIKKRTSPSSMTGSDLETGTWTSSLWDAGTSTEQKLDSLDINDSIGTNETVEVRLSVDEDDNGSIEKTSSWVSLSDGTNNLTDSDFDIDTSGYRYQVGFNLSVTDSDPSHAPSVNSFSMMTAEANNLPTVSGASPSGGTVLGSTDSILNVDLSDADGDSMDAWFFNANNNDHISSKQTGIDGTGSASVSWTGLEANTTYNWYVNVSDGKSNYTSDTFTFEVGLGINLTFKDSSIVEDGFNVYTNSSGSWNKVYSFQSSNTGGTGQRNTNFIDKDLEKGEHACYRVAAYNEAGESEKSQKACITP